eukprot:2785675-Karenia_brevis.AAC.1
MMCLLLMVICHFSMVMGMGPDTSTTEAVGTLHQQPKPGRDRALDSKHQGDGQGKACRAHERHQG